MVEMCALFTGCVTGRQLRGSQLFLDLLKQRGLNAVVIHGKQNSVSEPYIHLRMRTRELDCSAVDHVMCQRVCNGGDNGDGRTGKATEAGEVPRGFGEQRPGAEGDVQR